MFPTELFNDKKTLSCFMNLGRASGKWGGGGGALRII